MLKFKHYLLLFTVLVCSNLYVSGQYDTSPIDFTDIYPGKRVFIDYNERLNISQYSNRFRNSVLDYTYSLADGTQVQVKAYRNSPTYEVFERPPFPYMHIIYKEFYKNGKLKQKGVFLPTQLKVGKWFETDEFGNGFIIDYEAGRDTYGYNKVLEFLQQRGYYFASDGSQYRYTFWHTPENHKWGVRLDRNGQPFKTFTFDSTGQGGIEELDMEPTSVSVPIYGTFIQEE